MIEAIIDAIVFAVREVFLYKILKPICRKTGTYYLKFINIFLNEKIDLELSPNKGFIGLIIWCIVLTMTVIILVY